MSKKFKVGDKVIAKSNNGYVLTTNGRRGIVTEADEDFFNAKEIKGFYSDARPNALFSHLEYSYLHHINI